MTVLTVKIPDDKKSEVAKYVADVGGKVMVSQTVRASAKAEEAGADEDEVTHGQFFGENISRVIRTFFSKH